ncbi:MAG: hypothetical protein OSA37_07955 [Flavobacteriales bacterium]|nr:hypothetical protein [Flavobacteriales bacterium]
MVERLGFTHVWIALGAFSSTAGSLLVFSPLHELMAPDWSLALLSGGATGWTYTFQRWIKSFRHPEQVPPNRLRFMRNYGGRMLVGWTLTAAVALVYYFVHNNGMNARLIQAWPLGVLAGICSVGYAFNPFGGQRGWRDIARCKLPAIALGWGIATIAIPAAHFGIDWWSSSSLHFWGSLTAQILFIAGITVPFDVRDLFIDPKHFQTLPQRFGSSESIRRAIIFLALSAGLFVAFDLNWGRAILAALSMPLVAWAVRPRKESIYSLWLDGLLILQGAAVFWMASFA